MSDTFSIYVLSFAYGILVVLVGIHLVVRWRWRKKKLSRFKPHKPGDGSFKCQHIRHKIQNDFNFISSLTPDPKLCLSNFPPADFGGCSSGDEVPSHWYRMKAFDSAALLVSNYFSLASGTRSLSLSRSSPLPDFLAAAKCDALKQPGRGRELVAQCSEMYTLARYQPGCFGKEEFDNFDALLKELEEILMKAYQPSRQSLAHDALSSKSSKEPLLPFHPHAAKPKQHASLLSSSLTTAEKAEPSPSRHKKESSLGRDHHRRPVELSPLVADTDSQEGFNYSPRTTRSGRLLSQSSRETSI